MRGKVVLKELSKGVAATLVFFVIVESLLRLTYFVRNAAVTEIPLPYMVGDDYGPIPPWVDGLRILEPDETFIWRARPSVRRRYIDVFSPAQNEDERTALVRRFLPTVPDALRNNPVWEIALNSHGFRDAEFPREKRPSTFRIVCLGDSWTFGANVGQDQAYPQRLEALLRREFPSADFEVFNLGVLGYSSYQGLELLRRTAIHWVPDLVVIGFAMNDAKVDGYRDKDMPAFRHPLTVAMAIHHVLDKLEIYKLLRWVALVIREQPKPPAYYIKAMAESAETEAKAGGGGEANATVDYDKFEPWTRVSPRDYESNLREMIRLARSRNARAILLANELWATPYRAVLEKVSRAEGVPLVDSQGLIAEAKRGMEETLEAELDLRPPATAGRAPVDKEIEIVFRVYVGKRPVPKAVYIVGAHPELGDLVPNKVAMYDDGTHGDQRGADNVWSYSARFSAGIRVFYTYTNSGREGRWEGLDVPHVRTFRVEAPGGKGPVYRPIESFGRIYLQADSWHTDAAGYGLIATALLETLKRDKGVQGYLARMENAGRPR